MRDYQKEYPIGKMCKVFRVSRSGYYQARNYLPSKRDGENGLLLSEIRKIHQQSKATYGSPRMTKELKARGFQASRPRVARLMKLHGIRAVHKKKFVVTTDLKHSCYPVIENKLDRNFSTNTPATAWVSDITYIRTGQGWSYLTAILDLYDRKVVGWALSTYLSTKNATLKAWKMDVKNRPPSKKLTFHSDRGIQYASTDFTKLLSSYSQVERSMSRKGNCWDNAVAESFFKTIKSELVYRTRYTDRRVAALSLFEWIETWYNRHRRHSALGNLTIIEYVQKMNLKNAA